MKVKEILLLLLLLLLLLFLLKLLQMVKIIGRALLLQLLTTITVDHDQTDCPCLPHPVAVHLTELSLVVVGGSCGSGRCNRRRRSVDALCTLALITTSACFADRRQLHRRGRIRYGQIVQRKKGIRFAGGWRRQRRRWRWWLLLLTSLTASLLQHLQRFHVDHGQCIATAQRVAVVKATAIEHRLSVSTIISSLIFKNQTGFCSAKVRSREISQRIARRVVQQHHQLLLLFSSSIAQTITGTRACCGASRGASVVGAVRADGLSCSSIASRHYLVRPVTTSIDHEGK